MPRAAHSWLVLKPVLTQHKKSHPLGRAHGDLAVGWFMKKWPWLGEETRRICHKSHRWTRARTGAPLRGHSQPTPQQKNRSKKTKISRYKLLCMSPSLLSCPLPH